MMNVGVLHAILALKNELTPQLQKAAKDIGPIATKIGAAMVAGFAAAAAAIVAATKAAINFADALDNQGKATQASAVALQVLNLAAERAGHGPELITAAFRKMNDVLGSGTKETVATLDRIGLSFTQIRSLKPEDQFRAIVDALSKIPDVNTRVALGTDLIGKGYSNLQTIAGPALVELEARMRELGLVIDNETVAAVDALGDDIELLGRTTEATVLQFGSAVAQSEFLRGAVNGLIEGFGLLNNSIKQNGDTILWWANFAIGAAFEMIKLISGAVLELMGNVDKLGAVLERAKTSPIEALISGENPFAGLDEEFAKIDRITGTSKKLIAGYFENLKKVADDAKTALGTGGGWLTGVHEQREIERLQKLHEEAAEQQIREIVRISEAHAKAAGEAWMFWDSAYDNIAKAQMDAWASIRGSDTAPSFLPPGMADADAQFGAAMGRHAAWEAAQVPELDNFGLSLEQAAQLTQVFGDSLGAFGEAFVQGSAIGDLLGDTFNNLALESEELKLAFAGAGAFLAAWGATETGSQGKRALSGAAAGAAAGGAIVPGWGHLIGAGVGALVGWLRGKGPADVGEDAGRDIGVALSQGLMEEIHKSGENAQMFLAEIFAEGDLGIDRLAEEVGDLFSMFERGEISEEGLLGELKETLPILIEHFQELGPEGQIQLERIIQAAKAAGIEFEELGELIALTLDDDEVLAIVEQLGVTQAAAEALGLTFDQLQTQIESVFAPETLETLAENFGKTTEEMRQILADLNVAVQTDLERLAAEAGLTVEDFQALGAALESATGIPAEQLAEFLKQSGQTAQELAASLGVDVSKSLGTVSDAQAAANEELRHGVELSDQLAFNLERAAAAAGGIRIPNFDAGGADFPVTGAQHGFHGTVTGPRGFFVESGVTEDVSITRPGSGKGAGGAPVNISIDLRGAYGLSGAEIAQKIGQEIATRMGQNPGGIRTAIQKVSRT